MADYVGIILALLLGVGFLFIMKYKTRHKSVRLIGYALLLMSLLLVVFVAAGYLADASHEYGH
ncbi:hypothetical protein DQG23_38775 [Paenibacillus contaminans]|uniref:DUF2768 domain-containing protein n=1 Tax=Paenibacillus contaminans TaxID=450362 RepID=A0A329LQD4_9BACL|nr:hypothetical protein DQG23_38775 [Paenibacillus contaminans]